MVRGLPYFAQMLDMIYEEHTADLTIHCVFEYYECTLTKYIRQHALERRFINTNTIKKIMR